MWDFTRLVMTMPETSSVSIPINKPGVMATVGQA
jgi:hypothetical protein